MGVCTTLVSFRFRDGPTPCDLECGKAMQGAAYISKIQTQFNAPNRQRSGEIRNRLGYENTTAHRARRGSHPAAQSTNLAAFTRVSSSSPAPQLSNSCNHVGQARAFKSPRNAVNSPRRVYAPPPPRINPPHPRVSRQRAAACCRRTAQAQPLPRRTPPRQPAHRQHHHRLRSVDGGTETLGGTRPSYPPRDLSRARVAACMILDT